MPQHGSELKSRGFSLVEVLVAMTVFTIGILAVMAMQSTSIGSTAAANRMSNATNIASEELERLMNQGYDHADLAAGVHQLAAPVVTVQDQYSVIWTVTADTPILGSKRIVLTAVNSTDNAAITAYHNNTYSYLRSGKDRPVTLTFYLANPNL